MMAMKWSWAAVAMMLVGCSSGADGGTGAGVPTGDNKGDPTLTPSDAGDASDSAASSEAATSEDAGGEADGGASGGTVTSEAGTPFTPVALNIYALQYGDTIEVAFSDVPVTTQHGHMIVLVYQHAEAGPGYVLAAGEARGKTRCQERGLPPATSPDYGASLTFDTKGRVSGGPVNLHFQIGGNYIAEFHDLTVTPSTYACQ